VIVTGAATSYVRFATENRRFLAFGLIMTFGSSFGQTHFIGVFGPSIQAEFGLSHASWGTIYMAGTLLSALLLPFTGRWIDRISLRRYAVLVCIGLTIACLAAAAAPAAWFLIIVIFLLRQMGQGLASHTAITGMVKYFRHNRGKAIALALLGHPIARAIMPLGAVVAISAMGWRETYVACAILAALVMLPLIAWLLHGGVENRLFDPQSGKSRSATSRPVIEGDRSLAQLLRDPFFWLVVPGVIAPAVIDHGPVLSPIDHCRHEGLVAILGYRRVHFLRCGNGGGIDFDGAAGRQDWCYSIAARDVAAIGRGHTDPCVV
jgi:MFS family permease